mgnify:FL=1|tara:strand:+ start:188 stop:1045 length:858 start_codon:yes stop_codon:yes gene_type:complete
MSINSNENKKMLWDLLSPTFPENLSIHQRMKQFIDDISTTLHRDRFKYKSNIMQMNKILLSESKKYLTKCIQESNQNQKNIQKAGQMQERSMVNSRNYDKFTTKKEHTTTFEKRLRDKQEKFNQLIDGKKPKTIDFSDKMDKPISTMNSLIDSTLAEREKELSSITSKYNKKDVEKWLQNGGNIDSTSTNISIKNEIKGILKPIEIGKEESQKRVTFEVKEKTSNEKSPTQETTTFFSRLKQRSNSSDRELLQQIIENQKTLMEQNSTILKHLNKSNTASLSTDN